MGHDAQGFAHAVLRHLPNVLIVDADTALLHIIKTKHQAGQCRLARTRRPHHGHRLARWNFKTDVVQDGAIGLVGKRDVFKLQVGTVLAVKVGGIGGIGHFALAVHEHKHFVQVGQTLFDLSVQHAQKVQGNVELNHEGVDHDQVAQSHAAIDYTLRGAPQHGHQGHGNDQLLACVQQRQ